MSGGAKEPLVRVWLADTVYALRALLATPRYSLPALLSLALGARRVPTGRGDHH